MVKSKFRLWALLPLLLIIFGSVILFTLISTAIKSPDNVPKSIYVYFLLLVGAIIVLLFGELRKRAIQITLNENSIDIKSYLGFGLEKEIDFKDFDGFTTSIFPSAIGTYEYLHIRKNDRKVITISEFYHKNYFELKDQLKNKMKFIGDRPYNVFKELMEIFK